jgi:hypothetical protein
MKNGTVLPRDRSRSSPSACIVRKPDSRGKYSRLQKEFAVEIGPYPQITGPFLSLGGVPPFNSRMGTAQR